VQGAILLKDRKRSPAAQRIEERRPRGVPETPSTHFSTSTAKELLTLVDPLRSNPSILEGFPDPPA